MSDPSYRLQPGGFGGQLFADEVRRGREYRLDAGREGYPSQDYRSQTYRSPRPVEEYDSSFTKGINAIPFSNSTLLGLANRKMTDAFCSCFFMMFWVGMVVITYVAVHNGDPRRLYHGFDYKGQLCGVDQAVVQNKYLYWPDPSRLDLPVCINACPTGRLQSISVPRESLITSQGSDFEKTEIMRQTTVLMSYPSKKVGGRFCLPTSVSSNLANASATNPTQAILSALEYSPIALLMNLLKDVSNSWAVLFFIIPIAISYNYLYLFLMRYYASSLLVSCMVTSIIGCAGLSFYCHHVVNNNSSLAEEMLGQYMDQPRHVVWWIGTISGSLSVLLLISGSCVASQLNKISANVQPAVDAMSRVQLLLAMPFLEVTMKTTFTILWLLAASYVLSNGQVSSSQVMIAGSPLHGIVRAFHYSGWQVLMMCVYVVGYLWGLECIGMVFKFVNCYALSVWYFTPSRVDYSKPEVQPATWRSGFSFAIYYHFGSLVAGGAVLIVFALVKPFSIFSEWVIEKTERLDNPCVKAMVYSCTCCIVCLQEIVGFVHKGALIQLVLRGEDFVSSAASSFMLARLGAISSSFAVKGAVDRLGATAVFQTAGMMTTSILGGCLTYWFCGAVNIFSDPHSKYFLENRIGIAMVAAIVAFGTSAVYMWTLDLVADTLIYCWLLEAEDDSIHSRFAPKPLRDLIFDELLGKDSTKDKLEYNRYGPAELSSSRRGDLDRDYSYSR